jgi:hypothetical protein
MSGMTGEPAKRPARPQANGSPTLAGGDDPYGVSLMPGGPLFRFFRRLRLADEDLRRLPRRIAVIALVAWLPLLVLSAFDGNAWSGVAVPFVLDIGTHAKLLAALPLLLIAERVVHERMPVVVRQFNERGVVADGARGPFDAMIASALRVRDSGAVEVALVAFVYVVGVAILWRSRALPVDTWYGEVQGTSVRLTLAGWWYLLVSVPIFQFLLYRWYFRLLVWTWLLFRVSRLQLVLEPLHPDKAAGLGFLSGFPRAFAPLLLAHGALLAGVLADAILFTGATLTQFRIEIGVVVAGAVFAVVGPLLVFTPVLARAKRTGTREYGAVAHDYVRDFSRKWVKRTDASEDTLLGTADIQSLADLGNSFAVVEEMRIAPVSRGTVVYLAVVTLLPLAPLVLTLISLDELLARLAKLLL